MAVNVVVLGGQGESTTLMVNGIKDSVSIKKIIIESPVSKKELLKRRIRTLGLMKVIGQVLFMAFNTLWLKKRSRRRIDEIKNEENLNDEKIDEALVLKVDSINSKKIQDVLKKYKPDVVVVNGTRIIKKEVIDAIDAPFINTHVGITPKYRGVHGGYWALTNKDNDHCGVTVHMIDTGIDTGDILYQDTIQVTDKDSFNTYPYLQIAKAIPLMKKAIHEAVAKTYKIQKVDLPSKLWSHPTIVEYLKYRILFGVK